jgi:hypothetical protein
MCKCKAMLQAYADWLTKNSKGPGDYRVGFTLVTNIGGDAQGLANTNPVSYGPGSLNLDPSGRTFSGSGSLYFSTSMWAFPPPPGGFSFPTNPFDPNATHRFTITIDIETGRLTFSDPTSNLHETADLRCANGLMYGFANTPSATPRAFLIGFTTSFSVIPR